MRALRLILQAFLDYYEEIFHFLLMCVMQIVGTLLILPGPFLLAGLWHAAQQRVRDEEVNWQVYRQGIRRYGLRTWGVVALVTLGYTLVLVNLWFYNNPATSPFSADAALWISGVWITVGLIWTGVAFYVEAFLLEQEDPRILLAFRNALFFTMLHPLETLVWGFFTLLALGLSVAMPPFFLVTPAVIALLSLKGMRTLIQPILESRGSDSPKG